jgi:adenosine deaminase
VTLHLAEIPDRSSETLSMLAFAPERVGHATFLDEECKDALFARAKSCVEVCLTSNVLCATVPSYDVHHLGEILERNHVFCLCTDDKGFFGAGSSSEYEIAIRTFSLTPARVMGFLRECIDNGIFCEDAEVIADLHRRCNDFEMQGLPWR